MLAFAAVAVATVVALFVSTPWQSSPGFLERAEAALTPTPGKVLHFKVVTVTTIGPSCTVTQPPVEYWVDQTPPYQYRAFEVRSTDICKAGTPFEIGGEAASPREPTILFRPTTNTLASGPPYPIVSDWVEKLRQAINDGTAHHEGRTVLDGRTVERIRIACNPFPTCISIYAYVDPKSLYPERVELEGGGSYWDFVTYEYLPRTPANRALADIRAQHRDATPATREEQP